jgi:hypothetical protein
MLKGVPEVLGTGTLVVTGQIVRLLGVEGEAGACNPKVGVCP